MECLELVCNFKHCKIPLINTAWITSCSHAFCETHGKEICNSYTCPACSNVLSGKMDCVKADLKPSDKYKSMVLAGYSPEIIMEITNRALLFWQYQMIQEQQYQKATVQYANENLCQVKKYYEDVIGKLQIDMEKDIVKMKVLERELDRKNFQIEKLQQEILERQREFRELQVINNKLRLSSNRMEANQKSWSPRRRHSVGPEPVGSSAFGNTEYRYLSEHSAPRSSPFITPNEEDFAFKPVTPFHHRNSRHSHHHNLKLY